MKGILARLGDDIDDGPTRPAELRGIAVGVDLEFFHSILAELIGRAAGPGPPERLSEERIVVVRAVNDQTVQCPALTGEADVAGAHVSCHSRCEKNEVDEVPSVHREPGDRPLIHGRADLGPRGFHDRPFPADRHCLGSACDLELQRDVHGLADAQGQAGPLQPGKPAQLRGDLVRTRGQERRAEVALLVARDRAHHARRRVSNGHRRAGQHGPRLVEGVPLDRPCRRLGLGYKHGGRHQQQGKHNIPAVAQRSHGSSSLNSGQQARGLICAGMELSLQAALILKQAKA